MFFRNPKKIKSENNNPWFKPWFNILLHTQSIVCATVDSKCLEYLRYITLEELCNFRPNPKSKSWKWGSWWYFFWSIFDISGRNFESQNRKSKSLLIRVQMQGSKVKVDDEICKKCRWVGEEKYNVTSIKWCCLTFLSKKIHNTHCLYRFLDGQKIPASNLAFQAFEGFIGT